MDDDGSEFDIFFDMLKNQGIPVLKFGRRGNPQKKVIKITGNLKYLKWKAAMMSTKFGADCYIDLEKVVRIVIGQSTPTLLRFGEKYQSDKDKTLSLIYLGDGGMEGTFDIILPTTESFKTWYGALRWIVRKFKDQRSKMTIDELRLRDRWFDADSDHNGTMEKDECIAMVAHLNINMPTNEVIAIFDQVDIDKSGTLSFPEFVEFYGLLSQRPELMAMWKCLVSLTNDNFEECVVAINSEKSVVKPSGASSKQKDISEKSEVAIKPKDDFITLDKFIAFW